MPRNILRSRWIGNWNRLSGVNHTALVEWNSDAWKTLRTNYDENIVFEGDIGSYDFSICNGVDIVAGGPPCQPFSMGGKARENLKVCKSIPLSQQYDVQIHLVNAADYGVPQKRERVIIIGFRKDLGITWTLPPITHSFDSLLWDKYVTNSYWDRHGVSPTNAEFASFARIKNALLLKYGFSPPELLSWRTVRDALINIPSVGETTYYPSEHIIRDGAREYPGHTGSPIDEPAKTIKAGGHDVPGGENMIKFSDGSFRYFTIFEAKRIQTFPDEYRIIGSWTEAMRQLGNAVTVKLAKIVSSSILACL